MGTTMGRPRPRSKRSHSPQAPDAGRGEGERARLSQNRPLSWRSALLLLIPLALLAVGSDVALCAFISDHYARHGHLAVPLGIAAAALGFTALTVYACILVWGDLRKGHGDRPREKPSSRNAKNGATKERP